MSDKEITTKSGVLKLLEDGDNLMVDRGFDSPGILPTGVTFNVPPVVGSQPHLIAQEIEETAPIAAVRIYVRTTIFLMNICHSHCNLF